MLYRVLKPLSRGETIIPAGTIGKLEWLRDDARQVLLERGKIAEVAPPPLSEIPDYQWLARRGKKHGIVTVTDFLERDDDWLASRIGVKESTVRRYRRELTALIT